MLILKNKLSKWKMKTWDWKWSASPLVREQRYSIIEGNNQSHKICRESDNESHKINRELGIRSICQIKSKMYTQSYYGTTRYLHLKMPMLSGTCRAVSYRAASARNCPQNRKTRKWSPKRVFHQSEFKQSEVIISNVGVGSLHLIYSNVADITA
jgi:hypothetical protein